MKITVQEVEGRLVVSLSGEMDTTAAVEAETALQPLAESDGKDVVLDCTDLEYIASSGLRVLLNVLKKVKAGGGRITLRNVNEVIRDVLELTGFISLFEFE